MAQIVITYLTTLVLCVLVYSTVNASILGDVAKDGYNLNACNSTNSSNQCPPWFTPQVNYSTCECNNQENAVKCNSRHVQLHIAYCMTYDSATCTTYLGTCPYNTHSKGNDAKHIRYNYVSLPSSPNDLNDFMCGGLNRTGLLCSKCKDGLGPPVLSYTRKCVECLDSRYGWLLYVGLTVLPTTLLCVIIVILKFDATMPSLNLFILACQSIVNYVIYYPYTLFNYYKDPLYFKVLITFYGFWNLDFFRYVIPPFCISSQMNTLDIIALDYTVVLYPLLLTAVVYYCIEFHDRGCRVLMWMWKPFQRFFICIRKTWDLKGSVVNAFATFLLLSFSKLITVTLGLLYPTKVYNNYGSSTLYHYDLSYRYYGGHHAPFLILGVCILIMLIVLPIFFLLFYQTRCLQRCLACLRLRLTLLHELAKLYQRHYKDGTNGTRDYRWFAGYSMIVRILIAGMKGPKFTMLMSLLALLPFIILRPHKNETDSRFETAVLFLIAMSQIWGIITNMQDTVSVWPVVLSTSLPFLYITAYCTYKVLSHSRITKVLKQICYSLLEWLRKFINKGKKNGSSDSNVSELQYDDQLHTFDEHTSLLP